MNEIRKEIMEDELEDAICRNEIAKVKKLLKNGVNINNTRNISGDTPLFCAIKAKNVEMVNFLIEHGADVNYQMPHGYSALSIASSVSSWGNEEIVELLLEKGLDVNKQDGFGCTPLFDATHYLNLAIVEVLLDKGADINIKNNSGNSVLSELCNSEELHPLPQKLVLIQVFLDAGADWNKENVLRAAEKEGKILNILEEHLTKKYHKIN